MRWVLLCVAVSAVPLAACSSGSDDNDYVDSQGSVTRVEGATPPSVSIEPPPSDAPTATTLIPPSTPTNGAKKPSEPLTPVQLSRIARDASASLGDKNPDRLQAVLTTRSKANQLTGDEVVDDVAAYLVQVHGNFSTAWESRPAGANVPPSVTGTLSLVLNAYTGQQLDMGLGTDSVDLATLGPVINLP